MKRIEALADAISYVNQYHVPESEAYKLRNPGMLKAGIALDKMASANDQNIRIFSSSIGGRKALLDRLGFQCNRYKMVSLTELLAFYGIETGRLFDATDFLQRALTDQSIEHSTQAAFFLE